VKQDPPVVRDLCLSLEDLFYGCTKKMKISRRVGAVGLKGGGTLGRVGGWLHVCAAEGDLHGTRHKHRQDPNGCSPLLACQREFGARGEVEAGGKAGLVSEQGEEQHSVSWARTVEFLHRAVSPLCSQ